MNDTNLISDVIRPRLSIDLTPEQAAKLKQLIPWGIRRTLFSTIIDDFLAKVDQHGQLFIGLILERGKTTNTFDLLHTNSKPKQETNLEESCDGNDTRA